MFAKDLCGLAVVMVVPGILILRPDRMELWGSGFLVGAFGLHSADVAGSQALTPIGSG